MGEGGAQRGWRCCKFRRKSSLKDISFISASVEPTGADALRRKSNPIGFWAFALGWSWFWWVGMAVFGADQSTPIGIFMFSVGGLGPLLATLLQFCLSDRNMRADFIKRLSMWPTPWQSILAFATAPIFVGLALATSSLLQGSPPSWTVNWAYVESAALALTFTVTALIFGPLPEEVGWRGWAQPLMDAQFRWVVSSLSIGVLWVAWHLPLFFIADSGLAQAYAIGSIDFWFWAAGIVSLSVIIGLFMQWSKYSIPLAVLIHFAFNFVGGLIDVGDFGRNLQFMWMFLFAAAIVLFWSLPNSDPVGPTDQVES